MDEKLLAELATERDLLLLKCKAVEDDPKSLDATGSLYKYNKRARTKLDALRLAVASVIRQMKLARGEPVNDAGYSGRRSKR